MVEIKKIGLLGLLAFVVASCSIKLPISSQHDCGSIPAKVYAKLMTDAAILTGQFTEDVHGFLNSNLELDTFIYLSSTITIIQKDTNKLIFHTDSLLYNWEGAHIGIKPISYCNWSNSLSFDSLEYEVRSKAQRLDTNEQNCLFGRYIRNNNFNAKTDSMTSFILLDSIKICDSGL